MHVRCQRARRCTLRPGHARAPDPRRSPARPRGGLRRRGDATSTTTAPPPAINVTASIVDGELNVVPTKFGAGPVRFLVTNQTPEAVTLTFETAGSAAGTTSRSPAVAPDSVATLQVDTEEGDYELSASDGQIEPVAITVGAPRPSGQDRLLEP